MSILSQVCQFARAGWSRRRDPGRRAVSTAPDTMPLREILDCVSDAVLTVNLDLEIMYLNRMAEILTGFSHQDAVGRPLHLVFQVVDATTRQPRAAALARKAMGPGGPVPLENNAILITRDHGEISIEDSAGAIHDPEGRMMGAVIVFHDSRYSSEITARMADLACHDALTGLLNRHAFDERLKQSLAMARRRGKQMALLFIDLDGFKAINDAMGHLVGDAILKALANALSGSLRASDAACRYGGDEFVVLLSEIGRPADALMVARKVHQLAAALRLADGQTVALKLSIGVSIYPDDGITPEGLLQQADAAMYLHKCAHRRASRRVGSSVQSQ